MDSLHINLIKNYIEKSDFDENIILEVNNTDIERIERSYIFNLNEAIELIEKIKNKITDKKNFLTTLKEIEKNFFNIKNNSEKKIEIKKNILLIDKIIEENSSILALRDEYKIPEENKEVLLAYLLWTIIKKLDRRLKIISRYKEIEKNLIEFIDKVRKFSFIMYKCLEEKVMLTYVVETITKRIKESCDSKKILNLVKAKEIVEAGQKKAREMNLNAVFAVVNPDGNLILEEKMDGAIIASIEVAYKKAYTAATLKMETADLTKLVQPGAMFYGLQSDSKYIVFGGGALLKDENGNILGAIGVSGGSAEEDITVARVCVEAFKK